jgi:hypothetical protein
MGVMMLGLCEPRIVGILLSLAGPCLAPSIFPRQGRWVLRVCWQHPFTLELVARNRDRLPGPPSGTGSGSFSQIDLISLRRLWATRQRISPVGFCLHLSSCVFEVDVAERGRTAASRGSYISGGRRTIGTLRGCEYSCAAREADSQSAEKSMPDRATLVKKLKRSTGKDVTDGQSSN